jgi:hypothetical protein
MADIVRRWWRFIGAFHDLSSFVGCLDQDASLGLKTAWDHVVLIVEDSLERSFKRSQKAILGNDRLRKYSKVTYFFGDDITCMANPFSAMGYGTSRRPHNGKRTFDSRAGGYWAFAHSVERGFKNFIISVEFGYGILVYLVENGLGTHAHLSAG